jgi:hypothetical protein
MPWYGFVIVFGISAAWSLPVVIVTMTASLRRDEAILRNRRATGTLRSGRGGYATSRNSRIGPEAPPETSVCSQHAMYRCVRSACR